MSHYVYILRCRDNSLYTGYSTDVFKRFKVHSLGKGAKYTRARLPVKLVFYKQMNSKSEALIAEIRIKKLDKIYKEKIVESFKLRNNIS